MCYSNCPLLYEPGTQLEDVTCPCGHGYWDVLQAQFISGERVRFGQAPSKEKYEAQIKATFKDPNEYEAKLRAQFITHFLECDVKRIMDEDFRKAGKNDGSTLRRATAELSEVLRGDFKSRGRTALPERETKKRESSPLRRPSSTRDKESLPIRSRGGEPSRERHSQRDARQSSEALFDEDFQPTFSALQPRDTTDPLSRLTMRTGQPGRHAAPAANYSTSPPVVATLGSPVQPRLSQSQATDRPQSLSPLLAKFIQYEVGQISSLATFCDHNRQVFTESLEPLRLAIPQLLRRDEEVARRAAHRYLLLKACARVHPERPIKYFDTLKGSKRECERLESMVDDYILRLEATSATTDSSKSVERPNESDEDDATLRPRKSLQERKPARR